MKAIRIVETRVDAIDIDPESFFSGSTERDCMRLDDRHDIWVLDDALLDPFTTVVRVGDTQRVPLHAYVLGVDGERTVDASLTADQVRAMVRFGKQWTPDSGRLPLLGLESRINHFGNPNAWRVLIAFPDGERVEILFPLADDKQYHPTNEHTVHGDLRKLERGRGPLGEQVEEALTSRGHDRVLMWSQHFETSVQRTFGKMIETIDIDPCDPFVEGRAELDIEAMAAACAALESKAAA